jgi:hypothetical protein
VVPVLRFCRRRIALACLSYAQRKAFPIGYVVAEERGSLAEREDAGMRGGRERDGDVGTQPGLFLQDSGGNRTRGKLYSCDPRSAM